MTPRDTIKRIGKAAHAIGCQAGVGGMETAGLIVSYLIQHPHRIDAFCAGQEGPIDWPDFADGGALTWQLPDGRIVYPSEARAARISANEGAIS